MLRRRNLRALLKKQSLLKKELFKLGPLLKGSLDLRAQVCGKFNCICHLKGKKHKILVLCVSLEKKFRQIYVPIRNYSIARTWSKNYQRAERIIDKLTLINVKILRTKEKS
ncbi:MAG: hypothetical protein AUJ85_10265 [Elusimicrobia bacterium CG1_02_37_114]|nr:MAG: hypothetical protein AUJ85_10265 [Elusimicrobia bacterium CG1_02_37_114]PIV52422.1 MAG: hypothetical protein COS17_09055 [Elusimicrobia bacterium CG02_land_8_20_14_3_00_37_13]